MESTTVGIDLAKLSFSVCMMDGSGRVVARKELKREPLKAWLAQQPAGTVVAMEACGGAHFFARYCQAQGLVPRLMAAQFVKPFRKSALIKNDRNDAEAIATAARQGNMRFVAVKTEAQQVRLAWHRAREGYKKAIMACTNQIRGLLAEFDVIFNRTAQELRRALARLDEYGLPAALVELVHMQMTLWDTLEDGLASTTRHISASAAADERCQRVSAITGVGPLTADAVVAAVGNARDFRNGRQFAAWLGITPTQHGTGGKVQLGRTSCRGDAYLRTLLIQGARSSLQRAGLTPTDKATPEQRWIVALAARKPFGKVVSAIANKHARQIWAMLAHEVSYDPEAGLKHPMAQRGVNCAAC